MLPVPLGAPGPGGARPFPAGAMGAAAPPAGTGAPLQLRRLRGHRELSPARRAPLPLPTRRPQWLLRGGSGRTAGSPPRPFPSPAASRCCPVPGAAAAPSPRKVSPAPQGPAGLSPRRSGRNRGREIEDGSNRGRSASRGRGGGRRRVGKLPVPPPPARRCRARGIAAMWGNMSE